MIHSDPDDTQASLFDEASSDASQDDERGRTRQETSLDDPTEPSPNSPEDLGMIAPKGAVYGKPHPEPDPLPENYARSAIQHKDAILFRDWIFDQDVPTHARVTLGGIVVGLSGLGRNDLKWLCQAIRQAGRAPSPEKMRRAVMTHDVAVLREDDDD